MLPLLKEFPPTEHPTFFEVVTVMSLRYFVEQGCELVIWKPRWAAGRNEHRYSLASVITNIQLTISNGSRHAEKSPLKAGIIKPNVPVVTPRCP
jgi:folylpolyglutamate synthase/dihydropteroate synthase